jgi:hypothetical protein
MAAESKTPVSKLSQTPARNEKPGTKEPTQMAFEWNEYDEEINRRLNQYRDDN